MLENLAHLHYEYLYEQGEEGSAVCLKPRQGWVTLPLAICTWLASPQSAEAVSSLEYGASVKAVVSLQNQLKQANCFPQNTRSTGYYDKNTRAAVANLQLQSSLSIDGIAGAQTDAALAANQKCRELKLGSQGEAVRRMQIQLNNWGFPLDGRRLQPTGTFDRATQKALQEFQRFIGEPIGTFDNSGAGILWTPRVVALVEHLEYETFPWIALALENLKPTEKPEAIATILSILESSGTYRTRLGSN